jgi:hypothetical protein
MRADVGDLCLGVWRFEGLRALLEQRLPLQRASTISVLGQETAGNLHNFLYQFETAMKGLDLPATADRLAKVRLGAGQPNVTTIDRLSADVRVLAETAIDELKRPVFVHLPVDKSDFYSNVAVFYGESWKAYPSAQNDMTSACRCYALGENTAAVFHSMLVLQAGLYALAGHLGLAFPTGIELQQWGNITDLIESGLHARQKETAQKQKGQTKDQLLEFYSNTAMQFTFFKDAWRNRVAHGRKSYDADEAHTILVHVKIFMIALSKQVKEAAPSGQTQ